MNYLFSFEVHIQSKDTTIIQSLEMNLKFVIDK